MLLIIPQRWSRVFISEGCSVLTESESWHLCLIQRLIPKFLIQFIDFTHIYIEALSEVGLLFTLTEKEPYQCQIQGFFGVTIHAQDGGVEK